MKKLVFFHGTTELVNVRNYLVSEIEASHTEQYFPRNLDLNGPRKLAGFLPRAPGEPVTLEHLKYRLVERQVWVVADPDPHRCDWRCEGAYPNSECRCECNGRNHGVRGKIRCEVA